MIDFHAHIIPGVDDGSRTVEESIEMLRELKKQGVTRVVACPHFSLERDTVDCFLEKRNKALFELISRIDEREQLPKILPAAEILLSVDIPILSGLDKLCVESTNILMIEMPYTRIDNWVINSINEIRDTHNLLPIIAHIDRSLEVEGNKEKIDMIFSMDVLKQVNCNSIIEKFRRKRILNLIKLGYIHFLGSDSHGINYRPPNILEATQIIKTNLGEKYIDMFDINFKNIIKKESNF